MLKKLLFGMLGLALLTVLFAACTIRDAASGPSGPSVKMGPTTFLQAEVKVPKGQKLALVNASTQPHIIFNGTWEGATPKNETEPGAPKVSNLNIQANQTATIGPFTTAGTFKYYCSIHGGMNLTVVVA
ncbi:MAG: hypothetical protein IMW89_16570 [Ktedonobacteraceae bacterium]|nr:hypothetical protein [Ktedonobacteraceae bacterium]